MNMMKSKKGFTIIELVIVIAVIAVLAAVLIPTFASIIKKANRSADEQAVRQMNTALAAESVDGKPESLEALVDLLDEAGFNSQKSLIPVSKGYAFYWHAGHNVIVLADVENKVVLYPTDNQTLVDSFADDLNANPAVLFNLEAGQIYVDVVTSSYKEFKAALEIGTENVKLTDDLKMKEEITIPEGATVNLDLNGKTLTTAKQLIGGRSKYLNTSGDLTITNGTIEARGVQVYEGGKVTIEEGVTINAVDDNGGAAIWVCEGGVAVINGGTFTAKGTGSSEINYAPGVINNSGTLTINDGTFKSEDSDCYSVNNTGTLTINGGEFSAKRGIVAASDGAVEINGGKFTVTDDAQSGWTLYAYDGEVTVTAGEFSGPRGVTVADEGEGKIVLKSGVKINGTALTADDTLTAGESK